MVKYFLQNRCQNDTIGLSLYPNRATRPISHEIKHWDEKSLRRKRVSGAFLFWVVLFLLLRFVEKSMPKKNENSKKLKTKCSSVAKRRKSLYFIALGCYTLIFESVAKFKV